MADARKAAVIHEGAANLQRNVETVGGKLLLFEDKLVFESHSLNIQKGAVSIQLSSISDISGGWTKLFGLIPLIPNALITSEGDKCYRFTVFNRKVWLERIEARINR